MIFLPFKYCLHSVDELMREMRSYLTGNNQEICWGPGSLEGTVSIRHYVKQPLKVLKEIKVMRWKQEPGSRVKEETKKTKWIKFQRSGVVTKARISVAWHKERKRKITILIIIIATIYWAILYRPDTEFPHTISFNNPPPSCKQNHSHSHIAEKAMVFPWSALFSS